VRGKHAAIDGAKLMEPHFFQTRLGHQFYERTLPELVRQVERLANALERPAPPELAPAATPQDEPLSFEPGGSVVIVDNPHHPDASDIVGEVVELQPRAGFAGCDLVLVRYQRPRDGTWQTMPFGTAGLDLGDREAILARAARHDMQAARLRAMAAEVTR
jgi:hypothetical protein